MKPMQGSLTQILNNASITWTSVFLLLSILHSVHLQYPVPMIPMFPPPPPPVFLPPPPPPVQIAIVPVAISMKKTTKSTTTTTAAPDKANDDETVIIGVPMQVPCPMGPLGPPPIIAVPMPPRLINPRTKRPKSDKCNSDPSCSESDSDTDSGSSSSSDSRNGKTRSFYKRGRKHVRKRHSSRKKSKYKRMKFKRYRRGGVRGDLLKPVLSFVDEDGKVRLKQKLTKDEAAGLLQKDNLRKRGPIMNIKDSAESGMVQRSIFNEPESNLEMKSRNKELVFRPAGNMAIKNLSVSFNVMK